MKLKEEIQTSRHCLKQFKGDGVIISLFDYVDEFRVIGMQEDSKHEIEYKSQNSPQILIDMIWKATVDLCLLKARKDDFFNDFPVHKTEYWHDDKNFIKTFSNLITAEKLTQKNTFVEMTRENPALLELKQRLNLDINLDI